ncbi:FGGY family carbohydrate kinase [Cellulomonas sp. URHB0016]
MPRTALGVDVGTTNIKVAVVDVADGRVLGLASAPTPSPDALGAVLAGLVAQVLPSGPAPEAVGVASMAETGVPLDASGEPRGGWLRWDGHRAGAEAAVLAERLGRAELFAATGVRASAKVPMATWAWLAEHRPDHLRDGRWAGAADLVGLLLTGRLATDHTLAGRTMAYRLGTPGALPDGFDTDLLAEVGLRRPQVPDVLAPDEVLGRVRPGPFTEAGLPAGTPVTIAGHDHAVGAWAAGVRAPGQVADSVGTAEAVCTVLAVDPAPGPVAESGMSLVRTVTGRLPALLAGSSSAGATVAWWLRTQVPDEDPDRLMAEVRALGDDPGPVVVLPYLHGRQTPDPDPAARVRELGTGTPAERTHGLLLGLALQARWMLQTQLALAGGASPADVALLGAPMTSNPAWLGLKARVTPAPTRLVQAAEPVAAGAALLAADRSGLLDGPAPALAAGPPSRPRADDQAVGAVFARFVAAARTAGTPVAVDHPNGPVAYPPADAPAAQRAVHGARAVVGFLHTGAVHPPTFDALLADRAPRVEAVHVVDADVLMTVRREGVTDDVRATVLAHVRDLERSGASAVLVTCSSIGEVVDEAAAVAGVPVLRVDRPMAARAVAVAGDGGRVAVLATLSSTVGPTSRLVAEAARAAGVHVEVDTVVVPGAADARDAGDDDTADRLVTDAVVRAAAGADVVVLAQATMAAAADRAAVPVPVLTSPRTGLVAALAALGTTQA